MKKVLILVCLLIVMFSAASAEAAENADFDVTIVKFPVDVNYINFYEQLQKYFKYPMFLYDDITYFPLTYSNMIVTGLDMQIDGTEIFLSCEKNVVPKRYATVDDEYLDSPFDGDYLVAGASPFELNVNGEKYDDKEYPILFYKDMVYIPLTWDLIKNKLAWDFEFNGKNMEIYTSGFYYTANGDSYIELEEDGSRCFVSVPNKSYYSENGVTVYVSTETSRIGPYPRNMFIEVNGEKKKISGYTGYYQKNGPLFVVKNGYVYSVHYSDHDERDSRSCKINIATGEVEYLE